jgi:hypothetical protein
MAPTPSGQPPANLAEMTRAQYIAYVRQQFLAKGDTQAAQQWITFANGHPGLATSQLLNGFVAWELGHGLATALPKVADTLGKVPGAIAAAAAAVPGGPGGSSAACALHFPGVAGIGSFCIISKTSLRAFIGGLVLTGAGAVGITAAVILAAYGLGHTKSGQAITQSAGAVAKAGAAAGIA